MATAFDTLKAAKRLKQSGFNEEQAEALSEVFQEAQESHLQTLATKSDLGELRSGLKDEMARFRGELAEVKGDIKLLRWMIGFSLALSVALLWLLIRMQ